MSALTRGPNCTGTGLRPPRRRVEFAATTFGLLVLTACAQDLPLAPQVKSSPPPTTAQSPDPPPSEAPGGLRLAIQDVLYRLLPALEEQAVASEIRSGLLRLSEGLTVGEEPAAIAAWLELTASSLERHHARASPSAADAADLDVIRLVLEHARTLALGPQERTEVRKELR